MMMDPRCPMESAPDASQTTKLVANVCAGGLAGSFSMLFVYSLDYAR
jgi:hypothetical protein